MLSMMAKRNSNTVNIQNKKPKMSQITEAGCWKNIPDLIFSDIVMMMSLESLVDLHRSRQVCQNWNVMITQMTKLEKDTIRRKTENMAAEIRLEWRTFHHIPLLPKIITAASLAQHGMLGSVKMMRLEDVNLASVPAEHLASLTSGVSGGVLISNVSNCDMINIMDNVKSTVLNIRSQSLGSEETRALVRAMESDVTAVQLSVGVSLDIRALTQYRGQGRCEEVWYEADMYISHLRSWAQGINWHATNVSDPRNRYESNSFTRENMF